MDKVSAYGMYQNDYSQTAVRKKDAKEKTSKTEASSKTTSASQTQLSEKAKELLKELQEKYKNMDFFVADYSSDEEAQQYLSRGTKEYSVLIEPELLEEMANDEDTKAQYLSVIDDASSTIESMKESLGTDGETVKTLGFSVDKNGTVSYFAELEKMSEKQRERIAEQKEAKAEEAKAAEKKEQDEKAEEAKTEKQKEQQEKAETASKKTFVEADSIDALLEKIRSVDWDSIKETTAKPQGSRFDCCI